MVASNPGSFFDPIPIPIEPVYKFPKKDGTRWWMVDEYESPSTTKVGGVVPPLVSEMLKYLKSKESASVGKAAKDANDLVSELVALISIYPPDELLADYRAMRIRMFFERFLRAAIDALVSPDGASNAARVLTSDGGFRKDAFSELSRVMIASLISGKDSSIASAVRVYLLATG